MNSAFKTETRGQYHSVARLDQREHEDQLIARAKTVLMARMGEAGELMCSPELVKDYLSLELGDCKEEHFGILLLDTAHHVIGYREIIKGTIDAAPVYLREVARAALAEDAAALILTHNHPSGIVEPSAADITMTANCITALEPIGIRVLDHMIVGGKTIGRSINIYSFAEHGRI